MSNIYDVISSYLLQPDTHDDAPRLHLYDSPLPASVIVVSYPATLNHFNVSSTHHTKSIVD